MRHLRLSVVVFALAATVSIAGSAAGQTIGVLKTRNHTPANRTYADVDRVVVHVTEGSFWGSVRWLRNRHSYGSSHFIVSREGRVVQLVDVEDVAWHAGNGATNRRSIGIEHEGYTALGGFTREQYEASARLLGYLSRRAGFPLDRRHVIGHDEVPSPSGKRLGGIDGHTDPGPHWRWGRYLALAREYAKTGEQPRFVRAKMPAEPRTTSPAPRAIRCGSRPSVHSLTLYRGQTVAGLVRWRAKACGRRISRVDFLVDGKLAGRDSVWPYSLGGGRGLNTTELVNGWHTLSLRAHGPRRYRVRKTLRIQVANVPFAVRARGVEPGQAVAGIVHFTAETNARAGLIEVALGGQVVARGRQVEWDSTTVPNGVHELELAALAADGRQAVRTLPLLVANEAPDVEPAPHVLWQSLASWQTVSGPVAWNVLADGTIQQVEFWIDGRLRRRAEDVPFGFLWDTSNARPGAHDLLVRVVGTGGRIAESRSFVFVAG